MRDPFLRYVDSKRSMSEGLNRSSYMTLAMALPHGVAHYRSGLCSLHLLEQESLHESKRDVLTQPSSDLATLEVQRPHLVDFE